MRKVTVDLEHVLNLLMYLVVAGDIADEYFARVFEGIGYVTDEEIEEFARGYLTEDMRAYGFDEGDADTARQRLHSLRARFQRA